MWPPETGWESRRGGAAAPAIPPPSPPSPTRLLFPAPRRRPAPRRLLWHPPGGLEPRPPRHSPARPMGRGQAGRRGGTDGLGATGSGPWTPRWVGRRLPVWARACPLGFLCESSLAHLHIHFAKVGSGAQCPWLPCEVDQGQAASGTWQVRQAFCLLSQRHGGRNKL